MPDEFEATRDKGDSLELAVEHIFKVAKFKTERNVFIAKYEIDVKATIGDRTIIIECKNYQNSSLTIRNLIHQWNSKNQIINAHKIIIVLAGLKIQDSDYALASEFDIELWNQEDITEFFNLSLKPSELRQRLLDKISLKPITISERYRNQITYLVIKPLMSNTLIDQEHIFSFFNKWLRAYILTELQMIETTPEIRSKYIQIFERSKTKKGFLNTNKKRTEIEYWKTVKEKLESEEILDKNVQEKYRSYMKELVEEYNSQEEFFKSGELLDRTRKLIKSSLRNALYENMECTFYVSGMANLIKVNFTDEGIFFINVGRISDVEGNEINWVLTSEFQKMPVPSSAHLEFIWICSSFDEVVEKIYRLFTEYYEVTGERTLQDGQYF